MKNTRLLIIFATLLFSSCSSTLKVHELNEKGKLPTDTQVTSSEILIDKPLKIDTSFHLLFIKNLNGMNRYSQYIVGTLKNISGFQEVKTSEEMEQYVIKNNLADKVTNISDNVGLYRLEREIGNFLICETSAEQVDRYGYKFHFKIINAASSEIVLDVYHYAFNWAGLDRPLFNPVFNYYIDWLKKNKS